MLLLAPEVDKRRGPWPKLHPSCCGISHEIMAVMPACSP